MEEVRTADNIFNDQLSNNDVYHELIKLTKNNLLENYIKKSLIESRLEYIDNIYASNNNYKTTELNLFVKTLLLDNSINNIDNIINAIHFYINNKVNFIELSDLDYFITIEFINSSLFTIQYKNDLFKILKISDNDDQILNFIINNSASEYEQNQIDNSLIIIQNNDKINFRKNKLDQFINKLVRLSKIDTANKYIIDLLLLNIDEYITLNIDYILVDICEYDKIINYVKSISNDIFILELIHK